MKYIFDTTPEFRKAFKKILKKHKSLLGDLEKLKEEIQENPNIGIKLGDGFRKIRLNITSKNKGKSGGARVITHEIIVQIEKEDAMSVFLVDIYDKAEYDTIDLSILKELIKKYEKTTNKTTLLSIPYKLLSFFSESFFIFCLQVSFLFYSVICIFAENTRIMSTTAKKTTKKKTALAGAVKTEKKLSKKIITPMDLLRKFKKKPLFTIAKEDESLVYGSNMMVKLMQEK